MKNMFQASELYKQLSVERILYPSLLATPCSPFPGPVSQPQAIYVPSLLQHLRSL